MIDTGLPTQDTRVEEAMMFAHIIEMAFSRKKGILKEKVDAIRKMYEEGHSIRKIQKELHTHPGMIRKILKEMNIYEGGQSISFEGGSEKPSKGKHPKPDEEVRN